MGVPFAIKKLHGDSPQQVTVVQKDGRVVVVFDRPAGWLAFNPDDAIKFGEHLVREAKRMKDQNPIIIAQRVLPIPKAG